MDPNAQQTQNINEAIALLRDLAKECPALADVLNGIADSNERALNKGRLHVEVPGQGVLSGGDLAETTIETSWLNRFTATTLSTSLFPGRNLDRNNCADLAALMSLLATLTHETYHRRCDKDPDVYDLNIALLTQIRDCVNRERPCAAQLIAALNAEITNEQTARQGGPPGDERVKKLLLSGGVGVLAGALAVKFGLTAAIAGGAKGGGAIGAAGGPVGVAAGVVIGLVVGGIAYALYNPCE